MLKAIKNLSIYLVLLIIALNVLAILQTLWVNIGWIKDQKQVLGIIYSGFLLICFLLITMLSFYFLIRCLFFSFQIVKDIFRILVNKIK